MSIQKRPALICIAVRTFPIPEEVGQMSTKTVRDMGLRGLQMRDATFLTHATLVLFSSIVYVVCVTSSLFL